MLASKINCMMTNVLFFLNVKYDKHNQGNTCIFPNKLQVIMTYCDNRTFAWYNFDLNYNILSFYCKEVLYNCDVLRFSWRYNSDIDNLHNFIFDTRNPWNQLESLESLEHVSDASRARVSSNGGTEMNRKARALLQLIPGFVLKQVLYVVFYVKLLITYLSQFMFKEKRLTHFIMRLFNLPTFIYELFLSITVLW